MIKVLPDWDATYRPYLGKTLKDIAFWPMRGSDSPDLMANLDARVLEFSGVVQMVFETAGDLFLSWDQFGQEFGLAPGEAIETFDSGHGLDMIHSSGHDPWTSELDEPHLLSVQLYSSSAAGKVDMVTAVAQVFRTRTGNTTLWVTVAYGDDAYPGDDLLVCLNVDPPASEPLVYLRTVQ